MQNKKRKTKSSSIEPSKPSPYVRVFILKKICSNIFEKKTQTNTSCVFDQIRLKWYPENQSL